MRTQRYVAILVFLAFGSSACLKTRAQLREDPEERETSRGVPAQPVQDVQPQGQYVIDELKSEMTHIQGRLEDVERSQKDISTKSNSNDKDELKKLDARLVHLEQTQLEILENVKKLQESSAAAADPTELYKKAKAQYDAENYEGASDLLGLYLKTPKNKFAQDATFLRGECYFKLKQYKKAIIEYSKFPEKYTHSNWMPEALYKIGLSFDSLNMRDDAKGFYQELIEKFPKSSQTKKAKKKVK